MRHGTLRGAGRRRRRSAARAAGRYRARAAKRRAAPTAPPRFRRPGRASSPSASGASTPALRAWSRCSGRRRADRRRRPAPDSGTESRTRRPARADASSCRCRRVVDVDRIRAARDRVVERARVQHVVGGERVLAGDAARFADADLRCRRGDARAARSPARRAKERDSRITCARLRPRRG